MLDLRRIIVCGFIILIIGSIIGAFIYKTKEKNDGNTVIQEYIPEEEISDAQIRQTIITLYFASDKGLIPEARLIDAKTLINNPYETILELLIAGPKSENLQKTIPDGTKINKIEKEGEVLVIDLTTEFIDNHIGGEEQEKLTINSVVNTLTELTEINGIKIKINGEENKKFKDEIIKFDKIFNREKN